VLRPAYPAVLQPSEQPDAGFEPVRLNGAEPPPHANDAAGEIGEVVPSRQDETARTRALSQRRRRVTLLVEEEGLERGAIARIAGWLDVSPSTVARDVKALLAAHDPTVAAAADRAARRRNGNRAP
jgi:hypothetical protein